MNSIAKNIKLSIKSTAHKAISSCRKMMSNSIFFRKLAFDTVNNNYLITEGNEIYVVNSSDKAIARTLYAQQEFDFDKVEQVFDLTGYKTRKPDLLFVDIGANIGSICIPAIKRNLASHAIAIEPEPMNTRLLKTNIILNGLDEKIKTYPFALGARDGEVTFELNSSNFGDHRIRNNETNNVEIYDESNWETISVKQTTLDSILSSDTSKNVIIWMDTQGYEGYILQGANATLKKTHPLVLEFWPYGMKRSDSFDHLCNALCASDYTFFIDLGNSTNNQIALTQENLINLYNSITENGAHTDILVMK